MHSTPTPWSARLVALVAVVAAAGCVAPAGDDEAAAEWYSIVGGGEEWGFPLVGTLAGNMGGGELYPFCTATPVTPTVLITAAHCIDAFADVGNSVVFARLSPDGSGPVNAVQVSSKVNHPQWSMYDPVRYVNDVGLVRLSERIDEEVFPELHRNAETGGDRGRGLKVVGFGVSSPPSGGSGTKRSIDMSITEVVNQYFTMVIDGWRGVCYGDSGGPSFVVGEHRDAQWGVHARTQVESCGPAEDTSVGYYYSSFVRPTVIALDGTAADCGDGICTGIENEAECPADCAPYECGDGDREGPEVCDDGNTRGGDGCAADCLSDESCGNGLRDTAAGEVCDDGNTASGDGCAATCRSDETCGNGVVDAAAGEVCDDGNTQSGDGCSGDCSQSEHCGNGVLERDEGEVCDDGNNGAGDGCSPDCASDETCGNGVVDDTVGEVCDDANAFGGDGCSATCRSDESCGNGVTDHDAGEVCDDGNTRSGDGCSGDCLVAEGCGDGVVDSSVGEVCDDGNTAGGDGCSASCRSDETCGNGYVDVGETCDDGNTAGGDGCDATCGRRRPSGPAIPAMHGGCSCDVAAPARARSIGARILAGLLL